jgi:hypothetical protein
MSNQTNEQRIKELAEKWNTAPKALAFRYEETHSVLISALTELQQAHEQTLAEKDREIAKQRDTIDMMTGQFQASRDLCNSLDKGENILQAKLAALTAQNEELKKELPRFTCGFIGGLHALYWGDGPYVWGFHPSERVDKLCAELNERLVALARIAQPEGWWNCQAHGKTETKCTCGAATAFVAQQGEKP